MNRLMKRRGFILIELLVVIAIIGILAALIIVSLSGARSKATDTQLKNNLRNINTALEQCATDNSGAYPAADDAGGTDISTALSGSLSPAYITSATSSAYTYKNVTAKYISGQTSLANDKYFAATGLTSTGESPVAYGIGNGIFCTNGLVATAGGACGSDTTEGNVISGAPNSLTLTSINSGTNSITGKAFGVYGPQ